MSAISGLSSVATGADSVSSGDSFFKDAISALIKPARQFGTITAQITISERHSDDAIITAHPVQTSANKADHIIIQPARLQVRMGFSDYGLQSVNTYVREAITGGSIPTPQSITKTYQQLIQMQRARMPFKIVTSKRLYNNMVIERLTTESDERLENVLIIVADVVELLLFDTHLVSVPPNTVHADPSTTGSPVSTGSKILTPAPTTVTAP